MMIAKEHSQVTIIHVITGFSVATAVALFLLFCPYISRESALMLVAFDFLFVPLVFPLFGALSRKVVMMLLGNVIGLIWNHVFPLSVFPVTDSDDFCRTALAMLSPFANLAWIVSYWSLTLAALGRPEHKARETRT